MRTGIRSMMWACVVALALGPVVIGQESRGAFDAAQVVLSGWAPHFQRLLDVDGDGVMDAVGMRRGANNQTTVQLYHNDGSGRFSPIGSPSVASGGVARDDNPIRTGDLDGDGLRDDTVVVAGTNLFVILGNGSSTSATVVGPAVLSASGDAVDLRLLDTDGDGVDEAFVLFPAEVMWVQVTVAPFSFQSTSLGLSSNQRKLAVFERASGYGFVAMSGGAVGVLTSATIGAAGSFGVASTESTGFAPMAIAAGDLTQDGLEDVVAFGTNQYRVWAQNAGGGLIRGPLTIGGPATDLADVDGDGDLDGICCGSGSGGSGSGPNTRVSQFEIAINQGGGQFAPAFPLRGMGADHIAGAADLDLDGDVDLIAGRAIYFARQSMAAPPHSVYEGWQFTDLLPHDIHDVDGDGDVDLGLATSILSAIVNDGSGQLRQRIWGSSLGFPGTRSGVRSRTWITMATAT